MIILLQSVDLSLFTELSKMEPAIRQIVSNLGINVATKKLVCQEYCKLNNVSKLAPPEKKEIHNIIRCLIEELVANPDTSIISKDSHGFLPSSKSSSPCKKDSSDSEQDGHLPLDNVKENYEITNSEVNKIIHDEYLSSVKDLIGGIETCDNGIKKRSPSKSPKKRRMKRLRSKDVMDSILNSDNECKVQLLQKQNSPKKSVTQDIIYDDPLPSRQRLSKRKREEVMDSILDSDNDDDLSSEGSFSSPCRTPTKILSDDKSTFDEGSPLFKHKTISRRKNILSESESSDLDEIRYDERTDIVDSNSTPSKKKTISKSKRRCVLSDSDNGSDFEDSTVAEANSTTNIRNCSGSDSEDDIRNQLSPKLSDVNTKSTLCPKADDRTVSEKSKVADGKESSQKNETVKKCIVVITDCLKDSRDISQRKEKLTKPKYKKKTSSSLDTARKRKMVDSCSSEDLDDAESSCVSNKAVSHQLSQAKKSKKMKSSFSSDDLHSDSSNDLNDSQRDPPSNSRVLSANEDIKEVKQKQDLNKNQVKLHECKELKSLRAICRRIGTILRNTIELKGCDTEEEKIRRIKTLLREKGMKGRPSMKNADQFNLERELKELGGDCDGTGSRSPLKGSKRRSRREGGISSKSSPPITPCDDFSHMKDLFCADDSSD